jgi:hypothetical protein
MIEIKLDDKVIQVPTTLTIEKYQTIQQNPEKYNNVSELLALYMGLTSDELKDLPVEQIRFVEKMLSAHLLKPQADTMVYTFEYEGVTYGFENDWGNLSWGQWVDMEVFSQSDVVTQNIHIILALLYRPVKVENGTHYTLTKFKSSEVMERAEKFKNIDVSIWLGCASFFLFVNERLLNNIETSLKARTRIERMLKPLRRILPKFLLPNPLQDFILNLPTNLQKKTSPK